MRIAILAGLTADAKLNRNRIIDAHIRNAIVISDYLRADFIYNSRDYIRASTTKYDAIIVEYGTGYSPFQMIERVISFSQDAKIYWLTNEYNIQCPINKKKRRAEGRKISLFTNVDAIKYKNSRYDKVHSINLNVLLARKPNKPIPKKYDCIYFGTFRVNRIKYFKEYLQDGIYLSTSTKNFKKYKHKGCNPKLIGKLSWIHNKETLNNFRYSLYIEDEYTHTVFNHLANRWYEAGFCNNVMFFDKNCWNTINKSELLPFKDQVKDYVVSDHKDLMEKIKFCNKDFQKHLNIQKEWRKGENDWKIQLLESIKDILNSNYSSI